MRGRNKSNVRFAGTNGLSNTTHTAYPMRTCRQSQARAELPGVSRPSPGASRDRRRGERPGPGKPPIRGAWDPQHGQALLAGGRRKVQKRSLVLSHQETRTCRRISTEVVSTKGVSTEEISTDGVYTEEVSMEEVSTDGVSTDGVPQMASPQKRSP